nr:uncharacterized protein LOC112004119 [Quercus suber]
MRMSRVTFICINLYDSKQWITVDALKVIDANKLIQKCKGRQSQIFPDNYRACIDFLRLLWKGSRAIFAKTQELCSPCQERKADEEDPTVSSKNKKGDPTGPNVTSKQKALEYFSGCFEILKFVSMPIPVMLGYGGFAQLVEKIENILKKDGGKEEIPKLTMPKEGTSLLFAACNGITEMVEEILKKFPMAIHDTSESKNMILWVVEHRQPHVYELLLKSNLRRDSMFQTKDAYGNSALHLAAMLREHKHWIIPGAALQMQWEIKWYEFVKNNVPQYLLYETNNKDMTPADIFTDTHKDLVKDGGEWLNKTSESCSVVAALIATVAFAASTTIPGGVRENNGTPILEKHAAFDIFAISSLVALCVSVTALFLFLAILTSRYQEKDFRSSLPKKLLFGLTSLFLSIAAMLVSFCAGHFFVLKDKLKHKALPVYVVTCLPITFYAISQFPLYFDLIRAFRKNKNGQTQADIFKESHKNLVENDRIWLSRTSEACMVVAGLFVMATYTRSTTVPGGVKLESDTPYLETEDAIPSFRRFILFLLLLFTNSSGHVPCNFHIWVQRKRFPLCL